jgi:hypothetical protein
MKDKKLINEISRIGQIMGVNQELPILSEHWVRGLTKAVFSNIDNFISTIKSTGKNLTASDIDRLVDELNISSAEKTELKAALNSKIVEINSRQESFFDLLRRADEPSPIFKKLANETLTTDKLSKIKDKMISDSGKKGNLSKIIDVFCDGIITKLDNIVESGYMITSKSDLERLIKSHITERITKEFKTNPKLKGSDPKPYIDNIYELVKVNEKLQQKIIKIDNLGRIGDKPLDINTKLIDYSDIYVKKDGIVFKIEKQITTYSDGTRTVDGVLESLPDNQIAKYNELKDKPFKSVSEEEFIEVFEKWTKRSNEPSGVGFQQNVIERYFATSDEVSTAFDNIEDSLTTHTITPLLIDGKLVGNWSSIFYSEIFRGNLAQLFVNYIKGFGSKSTKFVAEYTKTQKQIIEAYELLGNTLSNPNNIESFSNQISVIETLSRKLKTQMELAQNVSKGDPNDYFHTIFKRFEDDLRARLPQSEAEELIKKLKNPEGGSGNLIWKEQSISDMIERSQHLNKSLKPRLQADLAEFVKSTTVSRLRALKDEIAKAKGGFEKLNVVISGTVKILLTSKNVWTFIFTNCSRTIGSLVKNMKGRGNLTGFTAVKNLAEAYLKLQIITYILSPLYTMVGLFFQNQYESFYKIENEENTNEIYNLINDYNRKMPLIGNDFDWFPYYDPAFYRIPVIKNIDVPFIELKPAPIPKWIMDWIANLPGDKTDIIKKNKLDEIERAKVESQQRVDELYNSLPAKAKAEYEFPYINMLDVLANPIYSSFYGLTDDEMAKLSNHLFYKTPQADTFSDTESKKENSLEKKAQDLLLKTKQKIAGGVGPIWVCMKKPESKTSCSGNSKRIVPKDNTSVIYNRNEDKLDAKLYYVGNKDEENKPLPNIKTADLRPIKELIPSLK